jgi:hypothetical protein
MTGVFPSWSSEGPVAEKPHNALRVLFERFFIVLAPMSEGRSMLDGVPHNYELCLQA